MADNSLGSNRGGRGKRRTASLSVLLVVVSVLLLLLLLPEEEEEEEEDDDDDADELDGMSKSAHGEHSIPQIKTKFQRFHCQVSTTFSLIKSIKNICAYLDSGLRAGRTTADCSLNSEEDNYCLPVDWSSDSKTTMMTTFVAGCWSRTISSDWLRHSRRYFQPPATNTVKDTVRF